MWDGRSGRGTVGWLYVTLDSTTCFLYYLQQRPREGIGEEDGPVAVRLEVDAWVVG